MTDETKKKKKQQKKKNNIAMNCCISRRRDAQSGVSKAARRSRDKFSAARRRVFWERLQAVAVVARPPAMERLLFAALSAARL